MDELEKRKQALNERKKKLLERKSQLGGDVSSPSAPAAPLASTLENPPRYSTLFPKSTILAELSAIESTQPLPSIPEQRISPAPSSTVPFSRALPPTPASSTSPPSSFVSSSPSSSETPISPQKSTVTSAVSLAKEKSKSFSLVRSFSAVIISPKEISIEKDSSEDEDEDSNQEAILKSARKSNRFSTRFIPPPASPSNLTPLPPSKSFKSLSLQEKQNILQDSSFLKFLNKSSLIIERSIEINSSFDILTNFLKNEEEDEDEDEISSSNDPKYLLKKKKRKFFKNTIFQLTGGETSIASSIYKEDVLFSRPIMSISQSPHSSDLIIVSLGARSKDGEISDSLDSYSPGVICLWSKLMKRRPELKFYANSPVLCSIFHPTEPKLFLGACHNGQIMLWDFRYNKNGDIQMSSLTGKGHKQPVYAMNMLNEKTLVTISVDGTICHWEIDRLVEPTNITSLSSSLTPSNLLLPPSTSSLNAFTNFVPTNPLTVSSMFCQVIDSVQNLIFGTASGLIYKLAIPFKPETKATYYPAHFGLITSLQLHPNQNHHIYKNLFLSASLDWTIKLWNSNNLLGGFILEFDVPSYDYISDIQWSPTHPCLFISLTSSGIISLWNISNAEGLPIDTLDIVEIINLVNEEVDDNNNSSDAISSNILALSGTTKVAESSVIYNKIIWNKDNILTIGDSHGNIYSIKINFNHKLLSSYNPNIDEIRIESLLSIYSNSSMNDIDEFDSHFDDLIPVS